MDKNINLKEKISATAFEVTQNQATEAPFSGKYNDFTESGDYHCICCDTHLFRSTQKFSSSCGWPAFADALEGAIKETQDLSHNMERIEISCKHCHAHLGHKFNDGPTGTRYCINSESLNFVASSDR
jgi:peptide-methionine (R)-S-oxide reductase